MPAPGEHKTVQARILAYAQEIGWRCVLRALMPKGEKGNWNCLDFWLITDIFPAGQSARRR